MVELPSRVLITGAGSGLGRRLAYDLASRGCRLVLGDRDEEGLRGTCDQIAGDPARVVSRTTDVTRSSDCAALVAAGVETLEGLDALVLCAGVSMWSRFDQIQDLAVFEKLIAVNYLGAVYMVHAALPWLRRSRGLLVGISSLQGEIALPYHSGYSAAKHALNGFLDALEFELAGELRFLTVMPGWISGTNLRRNAVALESGAGPRRHSRHAVTLEEASRQIVQAMLRGDRYLYIPRKLGVLRWLQLVSPGLVRRLIGRAVRAQGT